MKKEYWLLTTRGQQIRIAATSPKKAWKKAIETHGPWLASFGVQLRPVYAVAKQYSKRADLSLGAPAVGWKKVQGVNGRLPPLETNSFRETIIDVEAIRLGDRVEVVQIQLTKR